MSERFTRQLIAATCIFVIAAVSYKLISDYQAQPSSLDVSIHQQQNLIDQLKRIQGSH